MMCLERQSPRKASRDYSRDEEQIKVKSTRGLSPFCKKNRLEFEKCRLQLLGACYTGVA